MSERERVREREREGGGVGELWNTSEKEKMSDHGKGRI